MNIISRIIYRLFSSFITGIILCVSFLGLYIFREWLYIPPLFLLSAVVVVTSLVLCIQGIFTLIWMLYAWENPLEVKRHKSPEKYTPPLFSFSALIPAMNEEKVIRDTIRAVSDINYPENLKEIIILCRSNDTETIKEVNNTINDLKKNNIKIILFNDLPINKSHSLNIGLREAKNQVIAVFDAEDQPHREIYHIVNTLMTKEHVDIIQSGVQLMNYRSHWFSSINVLEYFFWFKSGLHFFSKIGRVIPLGGNTVFIKKYYIGGIGGWDENCLTEDADIGIRLVNYGAKIRVVYDEQHVTKEETPDCTDAFIKQRARWNQGFLQVLLKGEWNYLPKTRQKIIALYFLFAPIMQLVFLLYLPLSILIASYFKLPILISMFSFIPTYIFLLQISAYFIGIREFAKTYSFKYSIWDSIKILIFFYPYQIMLIISVLRAIIHLIFKMNYWEKTNHINAHRIMFNNLLSASF